ncbi:unnamed protein product [Adineta ricciae]|uniref:Uncharacterized protein n=1 Tax=Adineta ricciae TaxID=249248 RepID=A0A813XN18_ADIRI|nr:unnamed protein product [Adineta ricciae]
MIHAKISSPLRSPSRRKRQTSSGRTCNGSAKIRQQNEENILSDSLPARHSSFYKRNKEHLKIGNILQRKKSFVIAPDASIPNSSFRAELKRKEIQPVEVEVFRLRLDILKNLQVNADDSDVPNNDDDRREKASKSKSTDKKKLRGIFATSQKGQNGLPSEDMVHNKYWTKDTMPQLFKQMENEVWWKQTNDEKPNLLSMLMYLIETIKFKQIESYESACYYVIEIFRTFGIESLFVNQTLNILLKHLSTNGNDPLNSCTIRTIAQFMIEQKDIVIQLIEYASNLPPNHTLRQDVINAIKFITDISSSDDIELVLGSVAVVHDYPEDNFSLKAIVTNLANAPREAAPASEVGNVDDEMEEIHPLLKKISKEKWFPKENLPITVDYVLDAIITKLSDATKAMIKVLTTHLVQMHHVIGYSKEQFDRVSDTLILLLANPEADYRLIAATNLANLKTETKSIDIALLYSFANDPRILVRTECCDSLKILTGISSDTLLKDCVEDIRYLQTLPEEDFTLQNYLREKNRVPTPPTHTNEELTVSDQNVNVDPTEVNENITPVRVSRSPTPVMINRISIPIQFESNAMENGKLSRASDKRLDRRDTEEKSKSISSHSSEELPQKRQSLISVKTPISIQITPKRSSTLSQTTTASHSHVTLNHDVEEKENNQIEENFDSPSQTTIISDAVQTILEEHKRIVGFYRMIPNRPILIPHKITMDNILSDQSHIIIHHHFSRLRNPNRYTFRTSSNPMNSMSLFDFNYNQRHLYEIESVQLLSSLVVRAVQIHRHHDRFIPGSFSANFPNLLNVTPIRLVNTSSKLSPNPPARSPSRQYTHLHSKVQTRAIREGINIHRAQNMRDVLSNLLKTDPEPSITHLSNSEHTHITHAWLLSHLLKSQGVIYSDSCLQKIIHSYPKFLPLLHTRIPNHLISVIWNDPILKHIASIFRHKQNSIMDDSSSVHISDTSSSIPITEDEYSLNSFEYLSLMHRDDQKKRFLPSIRPTKMEYPRQLLKVGFSELEINSTISSNISLPQENKVKSRKRRVYMHFMMSSNESVSDQQEPVKSRSRQMYKADYQTISYLPIVSRVPTYK